MGILNDSFMTAPNPIQGLSRRQSRRMGKVTKFRGSAVSAKVIKELVRLGYLQPAKRHKPHLVERAVARLRTELVRDGVVRGGKPSSGQAPAAADHERQPRPIAGLSAPSQAGDLTSSETDGT